MLGYLALGLMEWVFVGWAGSVALRSVAKEKAKNYFVGSLVFCSVLAVIWAMFGSMVGGILMFIISSTTVLALAFISYYPKRYHGWKLAVLWMAGVMVLLMFNGSALAIEISKLSPI